MDLRPLLLASLLLLPSSCGGSEVSANDSLDAGHRSISAGDYPVALEHFDAALAVLDPDHEHYVEAKLLQLKAMAHVDAEKTKTQLMLFSHESGTGPKYYRDVVDDLRAAAELQANAGDGEEAKRTIEVALEILLTGANVYPDHPERPDWEKLIKATQDAIPRFLAPASLKEMGSLGYVGDEN